MQAFLFHLRQAVSLQSRFPKIDWVERVNGLIDHHSSRTAGTDEERAAERQRMRTIAAREMRLPALSEEPNI